jgi:hypothetical protein
MILGADQGMQHALTPADLAVADDIHTLKESLDENNGFSTTDADDMELNMDSEWNYGTPDQSDDESEDDSDESDDEMM